MRKLRTFLFLIVIVVIAAALFFLLRGCGKTDESQRHVDTIPYMLQQIQRCSRLYVSEYQVRKIVTHRDESCFTTRFFGSEINVPLPASDRRVAIPINATLKAYIDMSEVKAGDITRRQDGKIEVHLPEPVVVTTSTGIDYDGMKQHTSLFGKEFSDEELSSYETRGRKEIIKEIPSLGIKEDARRSAAKMLIPIISYLGMHQEDIIITFTPDGKRQNAPEVTKVIH